MNGPVEGVAVVNEYGEYFYDAFIENIDKYQFNKILDVGNITVYFCVCTKFLRNSTKNAQFTLREPPIFRHRRVETSKYLTRKN